MYKKIRLLGIVCCCFTSLVQAQSDNSPYSRYGLGDRLPGQSIVQRGMGGLAAAYFDYSSINYVNPASYGRISLTTLDLGFELTNRTLRAGEPSRKFSSYSPNISYLQVAFPLKKNGGWGMNLGLNPITRVGYKINSSDSLRRPNFSQPMALNTLYEGNGGAYEAHIGTGFLVARGLTAGFNFGYVFGSKDHSTRTLISDTTSYYYKSNYEKNTSYNGVKFTGGLQYVAKLDKTSYLRLGAYGSLQQNLNASEDLVINTFEYSQSGAIDTVDIIDRKKDVSGNIKYPASYGAGLIYDKVGKWMIGIDYAAEKWSSFRTYESKDMVQDSWEVRLGGQVAPRQGKTYWSNVAYRAGFAYGQDIVYINNQKLPKWTVSAGASLPMRKPAYTNQFSMINIMVEYGNRGNNNNPLRENFFRIGVGLALTDIWFLKRKYD
ncbi:hypothetical protein HHL16_03015 [Pseudoflavitalea sp. G-6-1-2]|uniref:hypothetical protein n=1 Tax=Pseudoflavitalea sp. G-6-1-2 TaxID=2728841 RepID=UPI00146E1968|nr:hypothetical protein [Pseudoflavitalea sp. G-6-1-2]NML19824.1 hypothetical protein [Pseudoflavitalea sp. G-6-1-2]